MTIIAPGIYELSMDAYQADPCAVPSLSSGIAHRLVTQSPLHAWHEHPRLNPHRIEEESTTFDLGACAHAVLLEGASSIAVIEADDWRSKVAKDARATARFEGKIPVLAHKIVEINQMATVARAAISKLADVSIDLDAGLAERVLIWKEVNVWCRARPDWMSADRTVMLDYKSTAGSAEPNSWIRRQMIPLGYDLQAHHYLRGNGATGGLAHAQWLFLVQENYPPYACSFVGLSPATREITAHKWDFAVALWQNCLTKDVWKGYPNGIAYAEPTSWQMDEDEERRLTLEERLEYATV